MREVLSWRPDRDDRGPVDRSATDRPNLLLVVTDQQRWDGVGCVGGWVQTPHMDRLATEGVLFPRAYTNSPVCVPARVSLVTGRYPHTTGVWKNDSYTLPPTEATWMQSVHDAGYTTSMFGKTHLHPQAGDLRDREHLVRGYGFDHVDEIAGPRASQASRSHLTDEWERAGVLEAYRDDLRERYDSKPWLARPSPLPLELYPDVYVGRQAARYLEAYDGDRPWFCWVGFSGPHEPWDAPEPYAGRYDPADMPVAVPVTPHEEAHPRGRLYRQLSRRPAELTDDDIAALRANYAANITLIDDQLGELIRVVEARGELDRTVIALVSDHGEMNGDHGLLYKQNFLDPAVRIPFVVRVPEGEGFVCGGTAEGVTELMDIGATFVDLAGGKPVRGSQAESVVPLLTGDRQAHRSSALAGLRREVMLATDSWKIALNKDRETYLLFDLVDDPQETRNLATSPQHADMEEELRRELLARVDGDR